MPENESLEFQMIFGDGADSRGPVTIDNDQLAPDTDAVNECFAEAADAQLTKDAGIVRASTAVPSFNEIIGWNPSMESFVSPKHEPEQLLAQGDMSKASSGPGRIRLEKSVTESGEIMVCGFDHRGEVVYTRFEPPEVVLQ